MLFKKRKKRITYFMYIIFIKSPKKISKTKTTREDLIKNGFYRYDLATIYVL